MPTDLDQAFPGGSAEASLPCLLPDVLQHPAAEVLADPAWLVRYGEAVRRAAAAYDGDDLEARLWRWWTQIELAAADDPHLAFGKPNVEALVARVRLREAWLENAVTDPAGW